MLAGQKHESLWVHSPPLAARKMEVDPDTPLLGRGRLHFREIAERIDQRRDLGGQAAAGLADGLIFSPLLRQCHADARA